MLFFFTRKVKGEID